MAIVIPSPLVDRVAYATVVGGRDGNKWEGPGLDIVIILNDQVLWTHFYSGRVSVLMEDGMRGGGGYVTREHVIALCMKHRGCS